MNRILHETDHLDVLH